MGTTETIGHIERKLGMSETSRVSTFRGVREDADGRLRVCLFNGSDEMTNLRFEDDGEAVIGNPAATLDEALADVGARLG